jgi:hypothetical protein
MDLVTNTCGRNETLQMIGESLILASIQFSIGSVEMSSKFSVKNFSKDQETLQSAAYALGEYIKIAIIWTFGVVMLMYLNFGIKGAIYAALSNFVVVYWIYKSYSDSFQMAMKRHNLKAPEIFE